MFLSHQTYIGLTISVKSLTECVRFLLGEGVEYIFTERFCQDVLAEYFGNQRRLPYSTLLTRHENNAALFYRPLN